MNDKPRLIDAGALLLEIYKLINSIVLENEEMTAHDALIEAMKLIKEAPIIDAEPVVHGEWTQVHTNHYECSECKKKLLANIHIVLVARRWMERMGNKNEAII